MMQRLLVLDDEPDILRLMERIVKSSTPYQIQTTNNSLEFINIIENNEFDLIITDLRMPGMTGFDVLDYIQNKERNELVIVCTAFGNQETAMDLLTKGAFEYLSKPFRKEHITISIERAMKYQRLKRDSNKYHSLFSKQPYEKAKKEFMIEYINYLNNKYNNDIDTMADKSGIENEKIEKYLYIINNKMED